MKFKPSISLLYLMRRRRKEGSGIEDGRNGGEGDLTQDGTVDVHGRPASRRRTGSWKGASFVLVASVMSNLAFFGISANLVLYLTNVMHENNSSAATNVTNWNGTGYIFPLIVAFIADSYFGRFMGVFLSSLIYILGMTMLTVAASVSYFRPPQCLNMDVTCVHATLGQSAFLYAGLYVMDFGAGGVLVTLTCFGADQFDEEDDKEKYQKSSYFNWLYMTNLLGSFIAVTFFVYIQDNFSYGIGWGISGAALVLGTIAFLMGTRLYRHHKPGGNPLARMAQVIVASARKRKVKEFNADDLYEVDDSESAIEGSRRIQHTNKFRFLDKAAIVAEKDKEGGLLQSPWHVCTVTQVEEFKFLFRVLPIFLTVIIYTTCYGQLTSLFVEQGATMNRRVGSFTIPSASLAVFEAISVFFWATVYDRFLVPFLRKYTGNQRGISELKRIGIGLILSMLAMAIAALVERRRLHTARVHGLVDDSITPVPMSVFYLVPQYFVVGASEVFSFIGQSEFFYDQAPDALRSIGSSLALLTIALGFFVGTLLLTIVGNITEQGGKPGWIADNLNQGRVDLFYWLLAILSFINLVAFVLCAMQYRYVVTQGPITAASVDPLEQKDDQHRQSAVVQEHPQNDDDQ